MYGNSSPGEGAAGENVNATAKGEPTGMKPKDLQGIDADFGLRIMFATRERLSLAELG